MNKKKNLIAELHLVLLANQLSHQGETLISSTLRSSCQRGLWLARTTNDRCLLSETHPTKGHMDEI
jgi:hypothetical protein